MRQVALALFLVLTVGALAAAQAEEAPEASAEMRLPAAPALEAEVKEPAPPGGACEAGSGAIPTVPDLGVPEPTPTANSCDLYCYPDRDCTCFAQLYCAPGERGICQVGDGWICDCWAGPGGGG